MKNSTLKLITLPEKIAKDFFNIFNRKNLENWYCNSDPKGSKLGSGGGTVNLLYQAWKELNNNHESFEEFLNKQKKIIIHAGGHSRRIPAYAPISKSLMPIPIFKWKRGQQIDQTLLDLQIPFLEKLIELAPPPLHTLIASGDALITGPSYDEITNYMPRSVPSADIVLVGLWSTPEQAHAHGVFFCKKNNPKELAFAIQKPSIDQIQQYTNDHFFLIDSGIWLLSTGAIDFLIKQCGWNNPGHNNFDHKISSSNFYDLYSDLPQYLGTNPTKAWPEGVRKLSCALLILDQAEFLHFGTNQDIIQSSLCLQNSVINQRNILHNKIKPHSKMFILNSITETKLERNNHDLWIDNSKIGSGWKLNDHHVLTGIPENNWEIEIPSKICLDIIPIDDDCSNKYCIRAYGFFDKFAGSVLDDTTTWFNESISKWFVDRGIGPDYFSNGFEDRSLHHDIQYFPLFPIVTAPIEKDLIKWIFNINDFNLINDQTQLCRLKQLWLDASKISAYEISSRINLKRLFSQRKNFMLSSIDKMASNYNNSVFFQLDLEHLSHLLSDNKKDLNLNVSENSSIFHKIHYSMLKTSVVVQDEQHAFKLLKDEVVGNSDIYNVSSKLSISLDQIVWGRSSLRLDLAGGWSDTPPYCFLEGGKVVNMAIDINGQQPIQVFLRPNNDYNFVLNSIDLGLREIINTYEELEKFNVVGSPFSIPKAALYLAGFHGKNINGMFSFTSLQKQLKKFGAGIDISILSAVPKGSGAGSSSILAATTLASLSEFCGLKWSIEEIGHKSLVLEQLLTTGGGWQDQYGGILPGIKFLETEQGFKQRPRIKWLSESIFTNPQNKERTLLFYTGITRTAKNILSEIVKGMFLNSGKHLSTINEIKNHANQTYDTILSGNYDLLAIDVKKSWMLNKQLDKGTNPPEIERIISLVDDYLLGYKLLGAGGGGFMLMMAPNVNAAARVRETLKNFNLNSRFVDFSISQVGLQVTKS